ncbi:MAG: FAD-dependent monooxygenase [Actinobacteria bacterium]|nr:FAD-dependent monooxygenase [Actinomycetota bacterium]
MQRKRRKVAIVGGGPAGLFLARLLGLGAPGWDITVFERSPADATYGFGIGLGPQALTPVEQVDAATYRALLSAGHSHPSTQRIVNRGAEVSWGWGDWSTLSIARTTLLAILQRQASQAGATLRFETQVSHDDVAGADLIVAADGVNSALRGQFAGEFQPRLVPGHARFYWCGAPVPLRGAVFAFKESEHGAFTTHSYPYNGGMAGFMFETDAGTLRRAGLDGESAGLRPGESDQRSRRYLEDLYAGMLGGAEIATSNSRWTAFPVLTNKVWHAGNIVLLGDSAHTAHPSIGSGTRMAMEDAVTLAAALLEYEEPVQAFAEYERLRRPKVESLQAAALGSQRWWETFRRRLDFPLDVLGLHYTTRTGRYSARRMADHDPALVRGAARHYWGTSGQTGDSPIDAPLASAGLSLPSRVLTAGPDQELRAGPVTLASRSIPLLDTDPEGAEADELVAALRTETLPAGTILRLEPPAHPRFPESLPGVMLADRLRGELNRPVCVPADVGDPGDRETIETGLLTRRIDVVEHRPRTREGMRP